MEEGFGVGRTITCISHPTFISTVRTRWRAKIRQSQGMQDTSPMLSLKAYMGRGTLPLPNNVCPVTSWARIFWASQPMDSTSTNKLSSTSPKWHRAASMGRQGCRKPNRHGTRAHGDPPLTISSTTQTRCQTHYIGPAISLAKQ